MIPFGGRILPNLVIYTQIKPLCPRIRRNAGSKRSGALQDPKKTQAQIRRQRDHLDRAVIATLSSTRKDVDITQGELAERMAWSREIVSNIEQGRREVSISDLILIAQALNVDPEILFRRILRW